MISTLYLLVQDAFPSPNPSLGIVANFSALRTQRSKDSPPREPPKPVERKPEPPHFMLAPYNSTCTEGDSLTLFARVWSETLPMVSWFKGTEEVQQSARFLKRYNGNEYALSITGIRPEDRGQYRVRAQNNYGAVEATCHVTVHASLSEFSGTRT